MSCCYRLLSVLLFLLPVISANFSWAENGSVQLISQQLNTPDWFTAQPDNQLPVAFHQERFDQLPVKRRILVIYSKASSAYDQAFQTISQSFRQHRLQAGYLIINYRQQPELATALLGDSTFDLTFIAGSKATTALYTSQPKPAMPVVTVTAKDPVLQGLIDNYKAPSKTGQPKGQRHSYAFTSLNIRPESLTSYLQTLNPNLSAIGIVYGSSNQSALTTQVQPLMRAAAKAGIEVKAISINADFPETSLGRKIPATLDSFRAIDPKLNNTLLWLTGSTLLFSHLDQINDIAGNVPVLTAVPDLISSDKSSPMLSIGIGFDSNAALAALYGRQILMGRVTPDQLPVGELSPPDIAINFRKVEESGWRIPIRMFELATILFNKNGQPVHRRGIPVEQTPH